MTFTQAISIFILAIILSPVWVFIFIFIFSYKFALGVYELIDEE